MSDSSIIDAMVDSMLNVERKDMLINTCRNLFIEKDFSSMQKSVQKELNAISPRFTLGMSALVLAKELNDDVLKMLANEIMHISDKGTLQRAFEMVRKRLQDAS